MRTLFIILFASFIVSCNKELPDDFVPYNSSLQADTVWKPNLSSTAAVNDLLDIFTDHVSIQGFYADTGGVFVINDSLKIEIPANILLKNGQPVVGLVSVNISQYRTKGQMLAYNLSTLDYGQVLESVGAFSVQFYKNSDPLTIAPNKKYSLIAKQLTGTALQNLSVHYKDQNSGLQTTWNSATDGSAVTVSTSGYIFNMTGTGWFIGAKPVDNTGAEKIRLNMIMPPAFTNANTVAFAVYKEHNAVVRLKPDVASKSFYTESITSGKAIKVLTISKLNDQYYFGVTDAVATKGAIIKVVPEKKASAKDIVSLVLSL